MIIGIGIDIVEINRFKTIMKRKSANSFLERNFTKTEINYCNNKPNIPQHLAKIFAAKESISKALNMTWEKGVTWKDIEILINNVNLPIAKLAGQAQKTANNLKVKTINISISHSKDYATAIAIIT